MKYICICVYMFTYMNVLLICMHISYVPGACRGQERTLDPSELELHYSLL